MNRTKKNPREKKNYCDIKKTQNVAYVVHKMQSFCLSVLFEVVQCFCCAAVSVTRSRSTSRSGRSRRS